jgi:hypothetical protein
MGTMMKAESKLKFNGLDDLRNTYSAAFRRNNSNGKSGFMPEISKCFEGEQYQKLSTLEALRHVIVHRGARADGRFRQRVHGHSIYGSLQQGGLVELDGGIVMEGIKAAANVGASLISEVDSWLAKNKENSKSRN